MINEAGPTPEEMGIKPPSVENSRPDEQQQNGGEEAANGLPPAVENTAAQINQDAVGADGDEVSNGEDVLDTEGTSEQTEGEVNDSLDQESESLTEEQQFEHYLVRSTKLIKKALDAGVFEESDQIDSANRALKDPDDSRAVLEALSIVDSHTSDAPEWNRTTQEAIVGIKNFTKVSDNGEVKSITDLEAEKASSSDPARIAEIDKLLAEGEFEPEFKVKVEAEPEQLTKEQLDPEIQNVLSETNVLIQNSTLPEDVKTALLGSVNSAREVPESISKNFSKEFRKGELAALAKIGMLRALRNKMESQGLDTKSIDELISRSDEIDNEGKARLEEKLTMASYGFEQRAQMQEFLSSGKISEFMTEIQKHPDTGLTNFIFGTNFKNNQESKQFLDKIMYDPTHMDRLKKGAGQIGLLAALILVGAGVAGEMSSSISGSDKR